MLVDDACDQLARRSLVSHVNLAALEAQIRGVCGGQSRQFGKFVPVAVGRDDGCALYEECLAHRTSQSACASGNHDDLR